MNGFIDRISVNGADSNPLLGASGDRYYEGVDLTTKFSSVIAASPYNGNPWAWIKARIQAGDWTGIHVNDYIPFTANGNSFKACVAGINTYKGYGDTPVGNHIDFICRELWPTRHVMNPANYNNGLIPVETITGDGATTTFTLTREMDGIASVKRGSAEVTGYTYDAATHTLTFSEAPAAGSLTVTGTGSEHPWLASDLYLFVNSLTGQVPNGTALNPAVVHKDYTAGGIYSYLPANLKAVIVEKRAYLPKRYSVDGLLTDDNAGGWTDIGKLWIPSEWEVYGGSVWGGQHGYPTMGNCVQYPLFAQNMNRVKYRSGSRDTWWLLSAYSGNTTAFCYVAGSGAANAASLLASSTNVAAPLCFRIS